MGGTGSDLILGGLGNDKLYGCDQNGGDGVRDMLTGGMNLTGEPDNDEFWGDRSVDGGDWGMDPHNPFEVFHDGY